MHLCSRFGQARPLSPRVVRHLEFAQITKLNVCSTFAQPLNVCSMAAPVTPRTLGSCPKRIDENEVLEAGVNYNCEFDRSFLTPGSRNTMQPRKVRDGAPPLEASPGSTIPDAALEDTPTLAGEDLHEEVAGDDQSNEPASNELAEETENEEVAGDDHEHHEAAGWGTASSADSGDSEWGTHSQPGPARRASWAATQRLFSLAPDHGVDGRGGIDGRRGSRGEQGVGGRDGQDGRDGMDRPLVVGYMGRDGVDGRHGISVRRRHIVRNRRGSAARSRSPVIEEVD